jgi:hypothetical protein
MRSRGTVLELSMPGPFFLYYAHSPSGRQRQYVPRFRPERLKIRRMRMKTQGGVR